MWKNNSLLLGSTLVLLTACGGGGGGATSPTPSNSSTPTNQTPTWSVVDPDYSGSINPMSMSADNAVNSIMQTLDKLDLFTSIVHSNLADTQFLLFTDNTQSNIRLVTQYCESGNAELKTYNGSSNEQYTLTECLYTGYSVSGTVRKIVNQADSYTYLVDAKVTDSATGQWYTLLGHYETNAHNATFNLVMQDEFGQQTYAKDLVINASYDGDNYGLLVNGDIYIDGLGKATLKTDSFTPTDEYLKFIWQMTFTGDSQMSLSVLPQQHVRVDPGDNYLPVIAPLTATWETPTVQPNQAPQAIINLTANASVFDRNSNVPLSAIGSSDPEFALLTYNWQVIGQPVDANPTLPQLWSPDFIADLPGEYQVQLTVTDPAGLSHHASLPIKILRNAPSGTLIANSAVIERDGVYQAKLQLDNEQYDGPFTFKTKYAPEGLTIDEQGNISWQGALPDFGQPMQINYAITAGNPDRSADLNGSFTLNSNAQTQYQTILEDYSTGLLNRKHLINIKGQQSLINTKFDTVAARQLYLAQDNKIRWRWYNTFSKEQYQNPVFEDINGDGELDWWFTRKGTPQNDQQALDVLWQNGKTGEQTLFKSYTVAEYSFSRLISVDYNSDGRNDLIVSLGEQNTIFDVTTANSLAQYTHWHTNDTDTLPESTKFCDLNGDGFKEIVGTDSYGRVVLDIKNNVERTIDNLYAKADVNGDGICELFVEGNNHIQLTHFNNLDSRTELFFYVGGDGFFEIGEFDGQPGQELFYVDKPDGNPRYRLFSFDNQFAVTEKTLNNQSSIYSGEFYAQFGRSNRTAAVVDFDGDGISEILFARRGTYTDGGAVGIGETYYQSIAFNAENIVDSFASDKSFSGLTLHDYDGHNVIAYSSYGIVKQSNTDSPEVLIKPNGIIALQTNDLGLFYFSSDTIYGDRRILTKFNEFDHLQLSQTLPDNISIRYSDIQRTPNVTNNVLHLPTYSEGDQRVHLVSASDATVLHSYNYQAKIAAAPYKSGQSAQFASADGELFTIDVDGKITVTPIEQLQSSYVSFLQYDDDPQWEVAIYHEDYPNPTMFQVMDLETQTFFPLDAQGNTSIQTSGLFHNLNDSAVAECLPWSVSCRNAIVIDRYQLKAVDKLTEQTIWQSPMLPSVIQDARFSKDDSQNVRTDIQVRDVGWLSNR